MSMNVDYVESARTGSRFRSAASWSIVAVTAGALASFWWWLASMIADLAVAEEQRTAFTVLVTVLGGLVGGSLGYYLFSPLLRLRIARSPLFFFAQARGWTYRAGKPFGDTPYLGGGEKSEGHSFMTGIWDNPQAVLYQHRRTDALTTRNVSETIVLHLALERPLIGLLQVWPREVVGKSARLLGRINELAELKGEEIDFESAELARYYRVSGLPGRSDGVRRLLTPSAIVKLLEFRRGLPEHAASFEPLSFFEIQGSAAAFFVLGKMTPAGTADIDVLLELWKPIADWLAEVSSR